MIIKAIVLDFDGVIVESNQIKHQAFSELFTSHTEHYDEIMRYHRSHNAVNRHEKFRYIMENILNIRFSEIIAHHWAEKYSEMTRERIITCPLVNGASDFLSHFFIKYPLFIASATPEDELRIIIQKRNLSHLFEEVYGAPKNKTKIFETISEAEKIDPDKLLFIGDSIEDYQSAVTFGCCFIARTTNSTFSQINTPQFKDLQEIQQYLQQNLK